MPSCPLPEEFVVQPGGALLQSCAQNTPPAQRAYRKRIVICCDGTWNNSNALGGIHTNVGRLAAATARKCCNGMSQTVYYHRGAGTEESVVARAMGGLFGLGVVADIADVYRFVCENYEPGDELIFTGFSRGAFTARSVANMVCTLGLLNGFGLDNFGAIFKDYQQFSEWTTDTTFNPKEHLLCFNVANMYRRDRMDFVDNSLHDSETMRKTIENAVSRKREQCFEGLKKASQEGVSGVAKKYRQYLVSLKMILCESTAAGMWSPENVRVKAVGVWDTVGSLGIPYDPLQWGRTRVEVSFANQEVHENIQNAFHALALDECRIPFTPTLWSKPANSGTHLRQVWFPGSHSDVGGGLSNQQIATISFAWMADQLSSVGVEFNPEEMTRIFRTVDLGVKPRSWGLGCITVPELWAEVVDAAGALVTGKNGARKPGLTIKDGKDKGDFLENTNELIHPSARVRFLHGGMGPGDSHEWNCRALIENHYTPDKRVEHCDPWLRRTGDAYLSTHATISEHVSSVQGGTNITFPGNDRVVSKQIPMEVDLYQPENHGSQRWEWDTPYCTRINNGLDWDPVQVTKAEVIANANLEGLSPPYGMARWVWIREPPNPETQGRFARAFTKAVSVFKDPVPEIRRDVVLHEERIGMWERQFMEVNEVYKAREEDRERSEEYYGWLRRMWELAVGQAGKVVQARDKAVKILSEQASSAKALPGKLFNSAVGRLTMGWDDLEMWMAWPGHQSKEAMMNALAERHDGFNPNVYACDDIMVWQHGDLRRRHPAIPVNGAEA